MDFFTNILSGGLLGSVTSIFATWFGYKQQKEQNEFELKKFKAESEANLNEIKAQIEVDKVITEGAISLEEAAADTAEATNRAGLIERLTGKYLKDDVVKMMISDKTKIGLVFRPLIYLHLLAMDAIRGLIRPVLTIGIVWYVMVIIDTALEEYLLDDFGTENLMLAVIKPALQLILFAASTVISFWFSDKAMSRRYQKSAKVQI